MSRPHTPSRPASNAPRRFWPRQGTLLNRGQIHGPWRPSGTVEACGFFAVVWSTPSGEFYAPLHDFDHTTREELICECAHGDREAGYPGAWPWGRA